MNWFRATADAEGYQVFHVTDENQPQVALLCAHPVCRVHKRELAYMTTAHPIAAGDLDMVRTAARTMGFLSAAVEKG